MTTPTKSPRLSYEIPRALVPDVKNIAASQGMEVNYWLRKVIEKAVSEAR